jgi:hypothetical protein
VHGVGLKVGDVISASAQLTTTLGTEHAAVIEMTSTGNECAESKDPPIRHPGETAVTIELEDVNGATLNTPTVPGTYSIYQGTGTAPAKSASLQVRVIDSTCTDVPTMEAKATTGTVTLSLVSGNAFSGSFDVVLDSGDHITGSFDPEECPAIQTAINSTGTPICM